jgi:hypothetical protein
MILSFGWTTPAVVIGKKCVTRRQWAERTIRIYERLIGHDVDAADSGLQYGGKVFGRVKILDVKRDDDTRKMLEDDWYHEGFDALEALGLKVGRYAPDELWSFWKHENTEPYTRVQFALVSLNQYGDELRQKWQEEFNRA